MKKIPPSVPLFLLFNLIYGYACRSIKRSNKRSNINEYHQDVMLPKHILNYFPQYYTNNKQIKGQAIWVLKLHQVRTEVTQIHEVIGRLNLLH